MRIEKLNNLKPGDFGPEHFKLAWFYSENWKGSVVKHNYVN